LGEERTVGHDVPLADGAFSHGLYGDLGQAGVQLDAKDVVAGLLEGHQQAARPGGRVEHVQAGAVFGDHALEAEGVVGNGRQGFAQPTGGQVLLVRISEPGLEYGRFEARSLESGVLGSVSVCPVRGSDKFLCVMHCVVPPVV
jgi:hypothetical protein